MGYGDQYTTDPKQRDEITASPLRTTIEQLQGLPPILLINAEADVLRDEGETFANKLSQVGVPVTRVRFQGTIHDFVMLNPLSQSQRLVEPLGLLQLGCVMDSPTVHKIIEVNEVEMCYLFPNFV